MKDEPLYERVGHEPMTDDELAAAIAAYRADHPGERTYVGITSRLRRLNGEARERAEAEAVGIGAMRRGAAAVWVPARLSR